MRLETNQRRIIATGWLKAAMLTTAAISSRPEALSRAAPAPTEWPMVMTAFGSIPSLAFQPVDGMAEILGKAWHRGETVFVAKTMTTRIDEKQHASLLREAGEPVTAGFLRYRPSHGSPQPLVHYPTELRG